MPLCADPSATVEYSLPTDQHLPPETRPTFVGRFLTCRQMGAAIAAMDKAVEAIRSSEPPEQYAALLEVLAVVLVGWRNVDAPQGDREKLLDVLTPHELWSVTNGLIGAVRVGELDRKKSASPSASAPVDGAPTVA